MSIVKHAGNLCPPRVTSAQAMLETIKELGIVPFFQNTIPGYSIEEMTPASNWFDTQENLMKTPWDWKIHCVQSGDIAYGKFLFGGKAAFATLDYYRELRCYRQSLPKYRPDESQRRILDYLSENGSIGIKDIRGLLGVKKGPADAQATKLMMQCRLLTGDITRVYRGADLHYNGWQVSSFCTPEAFFDFGDFFGGSASLDVDHGPREAYDILRERIIQIVPLATDRDIAKMLG